MYRGQVNERVRKSYVTKGYCDDFTEEEGNKELERGEAIVTSRNIKMIVMKV